MHVGELELLGAPDRAVLQAALDDGRILVTAGTDFGTLLALSDAPWPSVLLLRLPGRRMIDRVGLIEAALVETSDVLLEGALVVVQPDRIRIRNLPLRG